MEHSGTEASRALSPAMAARSLPPSPLPPSCTRLVRHRPPTPSLPATHVHLHVPGCRACLSTILPCDPHASSPVAAAAPLCMPTAAASSLLSHPSPRRLFCRAPSPTTVLHHHTCRILFAASFACALRFIVSDQFDLHTNRLIARFQHTLGPRTVIAWSALRAPTG